MDFIHFKTTSDIIPLEWVPITSVVSAPKTLSTTTTDLLQNCI